MQRFVLEPIARNKKYGEIRGGSFVNWVKIKLAHGILGGNYPVKVARSGSKIPNFAPETVNKMLADLYF